jgi:hypothetical protein
MDLSVYSITSRIGVEDTTINNGSAFRAFLMNTRLTVKGSPLWARRGNAQYPANTGVTLEGRTLRIAFEILGSVEAGYDYLSAIFFPDGTDRILKFKDTSDGDRQWQITVKGLGVEDPVKKLVFVNVSCSSAVLITKDTETETTWAITASGQTQAFTIDLGNEEVYPVYDIQPTAARGYGQRFRYFVTTYNYTRQGANGYHIDITNGGLNTAAIVKVLATNTTSTMAGITASVPANGGTLTNLASTAALPASGLVIYDSEQIRYTGKTATTLTGITRAVGGTTAASHANPTTVYYSQALANGADVLVLLGDGNGGVSPIPYFFGDSGTSQWNQTLTKIWVPINYAARALGTLATGISNSETSFTLTDPEGEFDTTDGLFLMESEVITATSYDPAIATATDCTRGTKGTSAASHAAGITVRAINELWLYCGNPNATAPNYAVQPYLAQKPPFSLSASTNDLWSYVTFGAAVNNTSGKWIPSRIGATALTYSSDRDLTNIAPANPPVELGMSTINRYVEAKWDLAVPFGLTSGTLANVDRYNLPATTGYVKTSDGTQTAVAATTVANTWQTTASLVHTPAAVSYGITLSIRNIKTANFSTRAAYNVAGIDIALSGQTDSPDFGRPFVSLGAQQAVTYDLDTTLANTTTGESIRLKFDNMALGAILRVDTFLGTIVYTGDNRNASSALYPYPPRDQILLMRQGSNTLSYTEEGATGVNVIVKWRGRNNALG